MEVLVCLAFLASYLLGVLCGRRSVRDESEEYERRIRDLRENAQIIECEYNRRIRDVIMERELLRGEIAEMKHERDAQNGKG